MIALILLKGVGLISQAPGILSIEFAQQRQCGLQTLHERNDPSDLSWLSWFQWTGAF